MNEQERKYIIPSKIESYLKNLSKYYEDNGKPLLQEIIVNSKVAVQPGYSYDNWNGGIHEHAVYFTVPESIYRRLVEKKGILQSKICHGLNLFVDSENERFARVFFEMEVSEDDTWRNDSGLLKTRKSIPDSANNRIWEKDCYRVFLSHKTEVKKETAVLKEKLRIYGISCFVAHEDIQPTIEWQNEIENALHTMDMLVALLTENFHDSHWTDQEIGFAFGRGVPILSVKLEKDPYGFLGKYQALKCNWENAPLELAKLMVKNEAMVVAYIESIKKCKTYSEANELAMLLPSVESLTDIQINSLLNAFNENSQISDSFGFNGGQPKNHGKGLIFHLQRISKKDFKLEGRKIIFK